MFTKFAAAAVALALSTAAVLADPVGRYSVRGSNPGGASAYSGSVDVQRTGDTYRVTWDIGGTIYVGTGIGSKDFLAVSYRAGNVTGLALYSQKSDGAWEGVWTYANGRQIGEERWNPR